MGTGTRGLMSKIGDYVLQKMEELKIEELEELTLTMECRKNEKNHTNI